MHGSMSGGARGVREDARDEGVKQDAEEREGAPSRQDEELGGPTVGSAKGASRFP